MSKEITITHDEAWEAFEYDCTSGKLYWRDSKQGVAAGDEAGTDWEGFRRVRLNGHQYPVHALVWLMEHEVYPDGFIKHKNGNTMDNRIENLELVDKMHKCKR